MRQVYLYKEWDCVMVDDRNTSGEDGSGAQAPAAPADSNCRHHVTGGTPASVAVCAMGIVVLLLVAYQPVVGNGFIWDDDNYVTDNLTLRSVQGLKDIWAKPGAVPQYYPLVHTTFWIEYQWWEHDATGYHVVNVLLHGATAILLFVVLRTLSIRGALLAAAIFAVHPVHVESVAWITERKNVLSGMFYFASLLVYLRYQRFSAEQVRTGMSRAVLYGGSFVLFCCALLSKTVTCSLPAVILVIVWWRNGRIRRRDWLPLVPFFAVGLMLALVTVRMEKVSVGAVGSEWDFSYLERTVIAGRALWFYTCKLFVPVNLTFIYPRWQISPVSPVAAMYPATVVLVAGALYRLRHEIGRGPLAAALVFSGTLAPALGFFDVYPMRYSFVADHFQYLASVAIITPGAYALHRLARPGGSVRSRCIRAVVAVLLVALVIQVRHRCSAFENAETLWLDTLRKNPEAWIAQNNLGLIYAERARWDEAVSRYRKAIALKPDHAYARNNLAMALARKGDADAALLTFAEALKLKPDDGRILNNCANFLVEIGRLNDAIVLYERAFVLNPQSVDTMVNLGNVRAQHGDHDAAIGLYRRALDLAPDHVECRRNLTGVLRIKAQAGN